MSGLERTKGKDIIARLLRQRSSFATKAEVVVLDEGDQEEEKSFVSLIKQQ
jgi:hypothetical protein